MLVEILMTHPFLVDMVAQELRRRDPKRLQSLRLALECESARRWFEWAQEVMGHESAADLATIVMQHTEVLSIQNRT